MRSYLPLLTAVLACPFTSSHAVSQERAPAVARFVKTSAPVVALRHVRVIDGTGGPPLVDQTIVIRDGRIADLGPADRTEVPDGAELMDLRGRTVTPGFVMLHEHMFYPAGRGAYNQQEYSFPRLYLAGGATTVRTGGSRDPYGDLNLKRAIDAGTIPGPSVWVTGPYVNGPGLGLLFVNVVEGPDDARRFVSYWASEGVTSIKTYMHVSRAELAATIDEAHRHGIQVTGHLCSVTYREAADLGIDNLEHGLFAATDFVTDKEPDVCPSGQARNQALTTFDPAGPESRALIRHLVERNVSLTSTLTVFETSVPGRPRAPDAALDAMAPDARDRYLRTWSQRQRPDPDGVARFHNGMLFEKAFVDAGGRLVLGTDPTGYGGVVAGYANQRAVELLVEAGFTAAAAIRVATHNGAAQLGIADEVGTIAPGMYADLLVVRGDPANRIADIRNAEIVFKRGIGYDSPLLFASVGGSVGVH